MVSEVKPRRQRLPAPDGISHTNGYFAPPESPTPQGPRDQQAVAPNTEPGPSWRQFVAFQTVLLLAVSVLFGILAIGFVARASGASTGEAQAAAPIIASAASTGTASPSPASSPSPIAVPADAARLPAPKIAPAVGQRAAQAVKVELTAQEVVGLLDDGIGYRYWTFNGTVPGPMIRIRQGDTVELTLRSAAENKVAHSIGLQAVTGPGGGGDVTMVAPGESKTFRFQALYPGVFTYQSASTPAVEQIANGMYGLIVVEPPQGLPKVDREFYVMQGEFYLDGKRDEHGMRVYSNEKALAGQPDYLFFNGATGGLDGVNTLKVKTGETVRIFYGVGGPNFGGGLHITGAVFDRVAVTGTPLDDPTRWATNVPGASVPVGGAAVIELRVTVPGRYTLLDSSANNAQKGATGTLVVEGPESPGVFTPQH